MESAMRASTTCLLITGLGLAASACTKTDSSITDGNAPPGSYTFCGALTATCNSFYGGPGVAEYYVGGVPNSCVQAAAAQCQSLQSNYSEAFQNAVVNCAKTSSPCDACFDLCVGNQ